MVVSSGSDSKAAAVTLTKYLSGYDSQVEFAKTAKLLPVMSSVLDHPDDNDSIVAGFAQMARASEHRHTQRWVQYGAPSTRCSQTFSTTGWILMQLKGAGCYRESTRNPTDGR